MDSVSEAFQKVEQKADEVDVVNASLGVRISDEPGPAERYKRRANNIVSNKDIPVVAAAGNDGPEYGVIYSPGIAEAVITVGSISKDKRISAFFSRGPTPEERLVKPEVMAIGQNIEAPVPDPEGNETTTETRSGTSMATAVVAGCIGLVGERHPEWSASEIKNAVISTADPLRHEGELYDVYTQGAGLVQVDEAIETNLLFKKAVLNFGRVRQSKRLQQEIEIENLSDQERAIKPDAQLRSIEDNDDLNDKIEVIPSQITIPPNESVCATIEVVSPERFGVYSGRVFFRSESGGEYNVILGFTRLP